VRVVATEAGTFADRAGLRPGDLLVELGGAPIFRRSDVALITRLHPPGTEVQVAFVRDGALVTGRAPLSERG
jgi:S1-C subfamily serine protease